MYRQMTIKFNVTLKTFKFYKVNNLHIIEDLRLLLCLKHVFKEKELFSLLEPFPKHVYSDKKMAVLKNECGKCLL